MATAAIVLAGGESLRMGMAKAGLAWRGSTLLATVVETVAEAVDRIVVVRSPGATLPDLPAAVEVVDDARPGRGPVEGLRTGCEHLGPGWSVFVTATDMPFLTTGFVTTTLDALTDEVDAAVPVAEGRRQPLAAAYRSDLAALGDENLKSMHALLDRCRLRLIDVDDPSVLRNLNTPAEYAAAVREEPVP